MNYNQVDYFLKIVAYGNFSRAAENLFLSQSSLSKQIKALEDELCTRLFDRSGSSCTLTESGIIFCKYVIKLKQNHTEMLESLGTYNRKGYKIKLGAIPILSLPTYGFAVLIADFQAKYINYNVNYIEKDQQSICHLLDKQEMDFVIIRTNGIDENKYNVLNLCTDDFVLLCANEHPLAKKKSVALAELKNEKFLLLEQKSQIYNICISALRAANINPQIIYVNTRHNIILEMVAKNLGITLMPKNIIFGYENVLTSIEIQEKITNPVGLVSLKTVKQPKPCICFWNYFAGKLPPSL